MNAGILVVSNTTGSGTGTGTVMVNSGGTLMGTGFITPSNTAVGANVVVNGGGIIAPGPVGSTGMLTLTSNVFLTGTTGSLSTALFSLNGNTASKLAINGNLDLSTTFDKIDFAATGTQTASDIQLVTYTGTLTGVFDTVADLPSGYSLSYGAGTIDLVVAAVPEPATYMSGLFCLGLLGYRQRRRVASWLACKRVGA